MGVLSQKGFTPHYDTSGLDLEWNILYNYNNYKFADTGLKERSRSVVPTSIIKRDGYASTPKW